MASEQFLASSTLDTKFYCTKYMLGVVRRCQSVPQKNKKTRIYAGLVASYALSCLAMPDARSLPLYCKQDIFIFYIQWLIFLLIGNTMKNTMLRKGEL